MADPDATFTLDHARDVVASLRPQIEAFLAARADFAELRADLASTGTSRHGGLAEAKALEARIHAALERFSEAGAQVKGYGPLLLDLPGERGGVPVLWCWLEGDADINWYHRLDTGFAGRRLV
jgi:hypothetical protein